MSAPCRQIVAERDGIRCRSVDSFARPDHHGARATTPDTFTIFGSVIGAAIALAAVIIRAQTAPCRRIVKMSGGGAGGMPRCAPGSAAGA